MGREVSLGQRIVVQVAACGTGGALDRRIVVQVSVCGTRGITGSEDCSAGSCLWDERYHWVRGL